MGRNNLCKGKEVSFVIAMTSPLYFKYFNNRLTQPIQITDHDIYLKGKDYLFRKFLSTTPRDLRSAEKK